MILNTGQRTDIPAFYAPWFSNRLREGFVCVRNPYQPSRVTRYRLSPDVVDLICFCTKNPAPMFPYLSELEPYGQFWFVTITPYGRDIEPNVPDKHRLLSDFCELSDRVGKERVVWRYDPILIWGHYTLEYHLRAFAAMAGVLRGKTQMVVLSFVDLYPKVSANFPQLRQVSREERLILGRELCRMAEENGMQVRMCAEGTDLAPFGADCSGCMTVQVLEKACGFTLRVPSFKPARPECACYISCDIGAYNSCRHFCRYCYANSDRALVERRAGEHDPNSPFLIGHAMPGDVVHDAVQVSFRDNQLKMPF